MHQPQIFGMNGKILRIINAQDEVLLWIKKGGQGLHFLIKGFVLVVYQLFRL